MGKKAKTGSMVAQRLASTMCGNRAGFDEFCITPRPAATMPGTSLQRPMVAQGALERSGEEVATLHSEAC